MRYASGPILACRWHIKVTLADHSHDVILHLESEADAETFAASLLAGTSRYSGYDDEPQVVAAQVVEHTKKQHQAYNGD